MSRIGTYVSRTAGYLKRNGVKATVLACAERLSQARTKYIYEAPGEEQLQKQREQFAARRETPLLTVVVPAYETREEYLKALLDSMMAQTYGNWELIVADASSSDRVRRVIAGYPDPRIRCERLQENLGISENTNRALALAGGDYVGLLDHDDLLTPDALFEMEEALNRSREAGVEPVFLYSDEDKCDGQGQQFYEPHFKTDFDPDLLLSNNYICHFLMMRREIIQNLRLRETFDGAQDYDLVLRAAAPVYAKAVSSTEKLRYVHVAKVLYHWRCHPDSTAENPASKRYAYEAGLHALEDLSRRMNWEAAVTETAHLGFYRVDFKGKEFEKRPDLGACASPLPTVRGRLISGIYEKTEEGTYAMRYRGLLYGQGGYMQRASMTQDVPAADLQTLRVRPEFAPDLKEALARLRQGADPAAEAEAFAAQLARQGARVLWIPEGSKGGDK